MTADGSAAATTTTAGTPSVSSPSSRRAAATAWAPTFLDTLTKYERNSERQLYIYGITTSRCVGCRHRLKPGAAACDNCQQAVDDKAKSCTRCSVRTPALWCHECDAYFCEPCHNKPHVLVLGGTSAPRHHCFPIDTASGKTLRRGAWSARLLLKCKAARREQMRLQKEQDAAPKGSAATSDAPPTDKPSRQTPRPEATPQPSAAPSSGDSDLERALSQPIDPPPAPVVDLTSQPAVAGADDPLKVAVIEEYEKTNEYVLKLEGQIAYISDAVRRASMQNVVMAAQISDRVNAYRRMLAEAIERRCRALAKVVLFSPDVRASARQMQRDQLADVPHVLTACHNKCGQLALAVRQHKQRLQELRAAIDNAIASGDATQIAQLQTLGTQIQEVEGQIRQAKSDRDAQFKLMVRFSKKVRDMVQLEAQALKP
ncbi:hypothetical protein P43SY_003149 [Pythium insidiosum]|uniref:B box-type domain-containing protein n=1 Tax=Pythium insidiosum TaxID=114742 RepID=A0AAD5Q5J3_PYTIN|nr:hypothetical protein P43SY_003149 [Pythium insidiosum]